MKKHFTLLSVLLLTACSNSLAQNIIFKEDFEHFNTPAIIGWNTSTHTGPDGWQANLMYLAVGSTNPQCFCYNLPNTLNMRKVAGISDCGGAHMFNYNNINDFMYTPAINLSGRNRVVLKWDSYFWKKTDGVFTEKATVEVSVDGGTNWDVVANVPANKDNYNFSTYIADISVYAGYSDVRIGFRYSDGGGFFSGWAVDNVQVFEPSNKDLSLTNITPENDLLGYLKINTGYNHRFSVYNIGTDTVHEFTLNYQLDNGAIITDSIRNVSIPGFTGQDFVHKIPDTLTSLGKHPVTAWVSLANDTLHWNDTLHTDLTGAYFMPQKIVAVEEGTATWSATGPQGMVYMKKLSDTTGYYACQVSVHDTDPMMTAATRPYSDYLFNLDQNYVPYYLLDRRNPVDINRLLEEVKKRQDYFGFADINIDPKIEGNAFHVTTKIHPAVDMTGDYRVLLIITEDDVSGTAPEWDQQNIFSGGKLGPMFGYENLPNPIPAKDMKYQYVVRGIWPSPDGTQNLPASMIHDQIYTVNFDAILQDSWNKGRLRANIFLLRMSDSSVVNSNKILFYLDIKDKEPIYANALLYPNPATDACKLVFDAKNNNSMTLSVTDISGRIIKQYDTQYQAGKNEISIDTRSMPNGLYFVNMISADGRKTLKLQVIR